jgi:hypothetical protein
VTTHTLRSPINFAGAPAVRDLLDEKGHARKWSVLLGRTGGRQKTSTVVVVLRVCQPVDDERLDGICGPDDVNR